MTNKEVLQELHSTQKEISSVMFSAFNAIDGWVSCPHAHLSSLAFSVWKETKGSDGSMLFKVVDGELVPSTSGIYSVSEVQQAEQILSDHLSSESTVDIISKLEIVKHDH